MEEDYELVPLGPIRRLEKKMEKLESSDGGETVRELIEIVRSNQRIVDEFIKINNDLMDKITRNNENVVKLTEKVSEFMGRLEYDTIEQPSKKEEPDDGKVSDMEERMKKLEKRINALLLTSMPKEKLLESVRR